VTIGSRLPSRREEFLARAAMLVSLPRQRLALRRRSSSNVQSDAWSSLWQKAGERGRLYSRAAAPTSVAPEDVDGLTAVIRERGSNIATGYDPHVSPRTADQPSHPSVPSPGRNC